MGQERFMIQTLHKSTAREYLARMMDDKIKCMEIARKFDFDYWDGDRRYGFGGYSFIPGRWSHIANEIITTYNLTSKSKILDVGCGKGFLLYEIQELIPGIEIVGLDISEYAIQRAHPRLKADLRVFDCQKKLPFDDKSFDLVISINTIHNFYMPEAVSCLKEIQRVGMTGYVVDEAYETNAQFFNLQCWALTAPTLITKREWKWLFDLAEYTGDFEFIYFD